MAEFDASKPFAFPRKRESGERWKSDFWADVERYDEGLSTAIGCYIFAVENSSSAKPWYVGLTLGKHGFRSEIFQQHKINHYDDILTERRGKPKILLFPLLTESRLYSRATSARRSEVEWLERTLIGMALSRNPQIRNTRDTKIHREIYVNGVLGAQFQGRPTQGAQFARKMLVD